MIAGTRTISDSLSENPKIAVRSAADGSATAAASWRPAFRSCQADTASITADAVTREASRMWRKPHKNTGLVSTAQMSFSCGLPVALLMT